jgi:hypothetical protein
MGKRYNPKSHAELYQSWPGIVYQNNVLKRKNKKKIKKSTKKIIKSIYCLTLPPFSLEIGLVGGAVVVCAVGIPLFVSRGVVWLLIGSGGGVGKWLADGDGLW